MCNIHNIYCVLDPVTVTFKGYSYVTYRVYDWRDRVHSEAARISFNFRVSNYKCNQRKKKKEINIKKNNI